MSDLPNPLTPTDCDLRATPVPLDMLVQLAVQTFGMSVADAETMAREVTARAGIELSEVGHA